MYTSWFHIHISSSVLSFFLLKCWHCWELCRNGGKGFWHGKPAHSFLASTYNNVQSNKDFKNRSWKDIHLPTITIDIQPCVNFSCFIFFSSTFFVWLPNCQECVYVYVYVCVRAQWALNHSKPWPSTLSVRRCGQKIWCVGLCRDEVRHSSSDKTFPRHCESCVFPMGKENWKGKDALFA